MSNNEQQKLIGVFGLGMSGISAARYLQRTGQAFFVVDTRQSPPEKESLSSLDLCRAGYFGDVPQDVLDSASMIIVSPGISPSIEPLKKAEDAGVELVGDVEIFARLSHGRVVAITGSNGKSTVTDLTHRLLKASGSNAKIGGNFGVPVLDFLPQDAADIYVLELSSFQLDTTTSLKAEVAVLLNVSEDHMDRYECFQDYRNSKLHIFNGAKSIVYNKDDLLTYPSNKATASEFSIVETDTPYHLEKEDGFYWLVANNEKLLRTNELSITGKHNWSNVLATLAILNLLNIDADDKVLEALKTYKGLSHRFELVANIDGVDWINDSKATNVGATLAALEGVDENLYSSIILIAGGDAKGGDLSPLRNVLRQKVSHLILIGKDAKLFTPLTSKDKVLFANSMSEAVSLAKNNIRLSKKQRAMVLLSPACASLDMYKNFVARGEAFVEAVEACA